MALTLNGSGITSANIVNGTIINEDIADLAASKLTGALPAISGAALTNLPGGGKVLQVVESNYGSQYYDSSNQTSLYSMSSLFSVSITPSSTSSKILICSVVCCTSTATYNNSYIQLMRGSSGVGSKHHVGGEGWAKARPITWLDSPSTTSPITYSVGYADSDGSGNFYLNEADTMEVSTSNIIAMEIQA